MQKIMRQQLHCFFWGGHYLEHEDGRHLEGRHLQGNTLLSSNRNKQIER